MLRKLRFYFALAKAFVKRDTKKFVLVIFLLFLSLYLLRVVFPSIIPGLGLLYAQAIKPEFVEGLVGKPSYPNPLFDSNETQRDISSLIFRGLTKISPDGGLVGDLAERFSQDSPTEYTFYLRKDVSWHDGKKFTADDVIYTVKAAQEEDSQLSTNFKEVVVEKKDDYTVKFKLQESFAPFPFVTTVGILPAHIPLSQFRPVGTGSFQVKKIDSDEIVLDSPNLTIKLKYFTSQEMAKTALKLGQIHALGGLTPQEAGGLQEFGNAHLYFAPLPYRQAVVYFNVRQPSLSDRNFRQGLNYLIDKENLRNLSGGPSAVVSTSQLPHKSSVPIPKERYGFSFEKAKKSFETAGYSLDQTLKTKSGEKVKLTITSLDDPELNSIANYLKEIWASVGIEIETRFVGADLLRDDVLPNRNFQVLVNFQDISPDPDQYVLWHTTQTQNANITGISSPKLDKLLEDARRTAKEVDRVEKYKLFTTLLQDEVPATFLYYPQYAWAVSKKVSGIDLSSFVRPASRFDSFKKWRISRQLNFLWI